MAVPEEGLEPGPILVQRPRSSRWMPRDLRFLRTRRDRSCPPRTSDSRCRADPARTRATTIMAGSGSARSWTPAALRSSAVRDRIVWPGTARPIQASTADRLRPPRRRFGCCRAAQSGCDRGGRRPKTKYEIGTTPAELTTVTTVAHTHFGPRTWLAGRRLRSMSAATLSMPSATAVMASSLRLRSLRSLLCLLPVMPSSAYTAGSLMACTLHAAVDRCRGCGPLP